MDIKNLESKAPNQPYINPTPGEITIVGLGRMRYIDTEKGTVETEDHISSKAAQLLKEIGCNAAQAQLALANSPADYPGIQNSFDACKPNNIKVNVKLGLVEGECNSIFYTGLAFRYEHWISVWGKIAAKFKDNPALGGWFLVDEPAVATMQSFADAKTEILKYDTSHPVLVNLYGVLAGNPSDRQMQLNGMTKVDRESTSGVMLDLVHNIPEYYDYFENIFGPSIWSSDFYPFNKSQKSPLLKEYFYEYLLMMKNKSSSTGRPFWTYIACNFNYTPVNGSFANAAYDSSLSLGRLRFQVFMALAYGAQGINYWNIFGDRTEYNLMPVDVDGKKTVLFDIVKTVNQEVKSYNSIFYGCKVSTLGVMVAKNVTTQTEKLPLIKPPYFVIKSAEFAQSTRWVVSIISNSDKTYLVIINCDYVNANTLKLTFLDNFSNVRKCLGNDTYSTPIKNCYEVVNAGDTLIFRIK